MPPRPFPPPPPPSPIFINRTFAGWGSFPEKTVVFSKKITLKRRPLKTKSTEARSKYSGQP
ncbi:unnamed protein product [Penicillium salamii]|uniref:Uncharacterized protein n=1 Tax=Penicillium salamii TaxID=1612424 RepID=A0A9W4IXS9_9EURO|nr:unnamed protein product [Penicillium salamii]